MANYASSHSLAEKSFTTLAAEEYAAHVWEETLNKQRWTTYSALGAEILLELGALMAHLSDAQEEVTNAWKLKFEDEMREYESRAQDLIISGSGYRTAYQKSRVLLGLSIIGSPSYLIDIMQPQNVLDIQRKYDIAREARHLSSRILDEDDVLMYRTRPGRCYFIGSPHITDDINVNVEFTELTMLRETGIVIENEPWLPSEIAGLVGRDGQGLKQDRRDEFWSRHQIYLGNSTTLAMGIMQPESPQFRHQEARAGPSQDSTPNFQLNHAEISTRATMRPRRHAIHVTGTPSPLPEDLTCSTDNRAFDAATMLDTVRRCSYQHSLLPTEQIDPECHNHHCPARRSEQIRQRNGKNRWTKNRCWACYQYLVRHEGRLERPLARIRAAPRRNGNTGMEHRGQRIYRKDWAAEDNSSNVNTLQTRSSSRLAERKKRL